MAAIASNAVYWQLDSLTSAYVVSVLAGAAYMTGTLIQLDLTARIIPARAAATVFATVMALTNFAGSALKLSADGCSRSRNHHRDERLSPSSSPPALPRPQAAGYWSLCFVAPLLNGGSSDLGCEVPRRRNEIATFNINNGRERGGGALLKVFSGNLTRYQLLVVPKRSAMSAMGRKLTSGSPSKMSAKCHEPTFARSPMGSVFETVAL